MYKGRRLSGIKNAAITVEIGLSVALGLIVLFLAFGLVSNNIQTLAEKTGLLNLAKKEKTTMNTFDKSAERQSIKIAQTQQEVQVVAEQGLDWFIQQAQETISKYKGRTDLNKSEAEDLAKALMIAKMTGKTTDSTGAAIDYVSFYKNNGIKVVYLYPTYTTTITNNTTVKLSCDMGEHTSEVQLEAVKSVLKNDFKS